MTEVFENKSSLSERYNKLFDMLKERGKGEINKNDVLRLLLRECLIIEGIEEKGLVKMAEELADMRRFTNSMRRRRREDEETIKHFWDERFDLQDTISAQTKEVKKLREALTKIARGFCTAEGMKAIADEALEGK